MHLKDLFKQSLFKNTVIYTLTDGISKAISFLLLPFVSYYIVPEQMGVVANYDVLQSIICLIAGQAVVNAIPYFYYERSQKEIASLVSNLILLILIISVSLGGLILFIYPVVETHLHLTVGLQLLTIVSSICSLLISLNLVLLRLEDRPYTFAKLQILQVTVSVALVIILVIVEKMEAIGKIYSVVLTLGIMSLLHAFLLFKKNYIVFRIDIRNIKELLNFGIPLLPHSLSFWLKGGMDKVLLTSFCGLAANGLYSMAMSFGAVYSIFNTAFNNAYVPYLQKRISLILPDNQVTEGTKIVRLTYKIYQLFIVLYFVAVLFCWVVINYILSDKYRPSFEYIPWIMLSLTIQSFYSLVIQFIYTKKKTFGLGIITFSCSVVQFILTYLLVRTLGSTGIKYSLVIGSLLTTLSVWYYSNKAYPMPWFSFKHLKQYKYNGK